jgi:hypothetical protein
VNTVDLARPSGFLRGSSACLRGALPTRIRIHFPSRAMLTMDLSRALPAYASAKTVGPPRTIVLAGHARPNGDLRR